MMFNIFTHRSTTAYCPQDTTEKDKIIFTPALPLSSPRVTLAWKRSPMTTWRRMNSQTA